MKAFKKELSSCTTLIMAKAADPCSPDLQQLLIEPGNKGFWQNSLMILTERPHLAGFATAR